MKIIKKISLLATGNEIIYGDIHDANGVHFAKIISAKGGVFYQHVHTSDYKSEISCALKYLLDHSDAVITTGGLGPTSDDNTRYAIAETIKEELIFNDEAWMHVVNRLKQFNLTATDANRQQALFPKNAELYPNLNGTAFGCHIEWNHKHIFMLPGPPKECHPLFHQYVLPSLKNSGFFVAKKTYRWLTLGLSEGEIAAQIDEIAKPYPVETGYRWNYPYIEIKIATDPNNDINILLQSIETLLLPNLVSHDAHDDALETLRKALDRSNRIIHIIDEATFGKAAELISHPNLQFIESAEQIRPTDILFHVKSSQEWQTQTTYSGTITIECNGYLNNQHRYTHKLSAPNRGPEIADYIKIYIAWQIYQFIKTCKLI